MNLDNLMMILYKFQVHHKDHLQLDKLVLKEKAFFVFFFKKKMFFDLKYEKIEITYLI